MSLKPRSITVAAANYPGGIRCYTKLPNGEVREASLALSDETLGKAIRDGNSNIVASASGWKSTTLPFKVHPLSSLCTIAWDERNQSIFYQDQNEDLREQRLVDGKTWKLTDFVQEKVQLGTNIASVASPGQRKAILVYQHSNNKIVTINGSYDKWDQPTALSGSESADCTGIGATSWGDLDEVRVYVQSKRNHIREWRKVGHGKWEVTKQSVVEADHQIGDITAVGWGEGSERHVRLYVQNKASNIVEFMNTKVPFEKGSFEQPAMLNSDIIGFVRHVNAAPGFCINVMWVDQKQILQQRIYDGKKWLQPAQLMYLGFPGNSPGKWDDADPFTDQDIATAVEEGQLRKHVASIRIGAGRDISAIGITYTNGEATTIHGDERSNRMQTFKLEAGEDITTVWYRTDRNGLCGLQFGTSKCRTSRWYGLETGTFGCLSGDGYALVGFFGAVNQRYKYISGLMPIWSQVKSRSVEEDFREKLDAITKVLATVQTESAAVKTQASEVKGVLEAAETKKNAMDKLADFTESVEMLHSFEHSITSGRVRATERRNKFVADQIQICNADAKDVAVTFGALSKQVSDLPRKIKELRQSINSLQDKAMKADVRGVIDDQVARINKDKTDIDQAITLRQSQVADAEAAVKIDIERYNSVKPKTEAKQNGTTVHDGPQNPLGSPDADVEYEDEEERVRETREQLAKDESELKYHRAHLEFQRNAIPKLDRKIAELDDVKKKLKAALEASEVKKALAEVDALEQRVVEYEKEADSLTESLQAIIPLCGELVGKQDSKAFAKALLPIVAKVEAHAGFNTLAKVKAQILLEAATTLAA